jgi:hypothetical protein
VTAPSTGRDGSDFAQLARRAIEVGLAVRGGFHPDSDDVDTLLPHSIVACTVVLFGFTGSTQWPQYVSSREANDGLPDPLDRWSRRVIGGLAQEFNGTVFYPDDKPPISFQRLAARCEPVYRSPIGILIHRDWGLWHAYRGALALTRRIELPDIPRVPSPCTGCADRPCLTACPVHAFTPGGFDSERCLRHVASARGTECRQRGCLARRACPAAPSARYIPSQAQFHMDAFLRAGRAALESTRARDSSGGF